METRDRGYSDLYTKNLARKAFEKHERDYVGNDNYMEES